MTDLHNEPPAAVTDILIAQRPDIIAIAGDLMHWSLAAASRPGRATEQGTDRQPCRENKVVVHALGFLYAASQIAPTYYSLGNHEVGKSRHCAAPSSVRSRFDQAFFASLVARTGARLLHNAYLPAGPGFLIGGLTTGRLREGGVPDTAWLNGFSRQKGYKILLCHHPEYYRLIPAGIDLVLAGHAHGGQWRLFNRGLYAPGQGLFPKYSGGIYHGRMIVSRGLANTAYLADRRFIIPRLNNPPEVAVIDIGPG